MASSGHATGYANRNPQARGRELWGEEHEGLILAAEGMELDIG